MNNHDKPLASEATAAPIRIVGIRGHKTYPLPQSIKLNEDGLGWPKGERCIDICAPLPFARIGGQFVSLRTHKTTGERFYAPARMHTEKAEYLLDAPPSLLARLRIFAGDLWDWCWLAAPR